MIKGLFRFTDERPLAAFIISSLILVLFILAGYLTFRSIKNHQPSFDLALVATVPLHQNIAVYINRDWNNPWIVPSAQEVGEKTYIFRNIPPTINHIRIDPGTGLDAPEKALIKSVKIKTSEEYIPLPDSTVQEIATGDWEGWGLSNFEKDGTPGGLRATGKGPVVTKDIKLDLLSRLPPKSGKLPALYVLGAIIAIACVFLFIPLIKTARAANKNSPDKVALVILVSIGAISFIVTVLSSFPGYINWDEWMSLNGLFDGVLSDIQPPVQTIIWRSLMDICRAVGLGPVIQWSALLIIQSLFFWTAAVVFALNFRHRWLGVLFLIFLASFPSMLAYLGHIGKDTLMGISIFVAFVILYLAMLRRSYALLLISLAPIFIGYAARTNAPSAVLPLCFYWGFVFASVIGFKIDTFRRKSILTLLSIGVFMAFFMANEAFQEAVIERKCCRGVAGAATLWEDIKGISVRVEKNLVPSYLYSDPNYSLKNIKETYFTSNANFDGLRGLITPEESIMVLHDWKKIVISYPIEYLQHRLDILRYFFGYTREPVDYAIFSGYFGAKSSTTFHIHDRWIELTDGVNSINPDLAALRQKFLRYFEYFRNSFAFRPWVGCILFIMAFMFLGIGSKTPLSQLSLYIGASGALYFLPYILTAGSSSFRYVWWSLLATIMVVFFRLDSSIGQCDVAPKAITPLEKPGWWVCHRAMLIGKDGERSIQWINPFVTAFAVSAALLILLGYAGLRLGSGLIRLTTLLLPA